MTQSTEYLSGLAELLVRHSTQVRRGDLVTVVADSSLLPVVAEIFQAALAAGGHPSWHPKSNLLRSVLLQHGSDEQLRHVSPFEVHRLANCDVLIVLTVRIKPPGPAPSPARVAVHESGRRELMAASMERAASGSMRYVLAGIPTPEWALDLGMDYEALKSWCGRASFLDEPDPAAAWRRMRARHARIIELLSETSELHVEAPGTDLRIDVLGRRWIGCSGEENMPDGEVYTGPASVEGVFAPNAIARFRGQDVEGVRLTFHGGHVVEATAASGEQFLRAMLDIDEGARGVGEFAIGTNDRLDKIVGDPFFDEKVAGTFHLALGAGYPATGSMNRSALHWDLVSDLRPANGRPGGVIRADGVVIHADGRFDGPLLGC